MTTQLNRPGLFFLTAAVLTSAACATFSPTPMDDVGFKDRAQTQSKNGISVTIAVLSAEEKDGPFAAEVVALDGLPGGRKLRQILDDAWSSPILSRRAKALTFAVVARGLGAERVEGEALDLLAAEGFDRNAAEEVLAHLASPALDAVESALVPFVRETLWYQPAPLQRRARQLLDELNEAELLETIGLAAFANAVCRLSVAIDAIEASPA